MPTDTETVKQHIEKQMIFFGIDPSMQISDICAKIDKYLTLRGQKSFDDYAKLDASVGKMKNEPDEAICKQSSRNLMIKKLILVSLLSNLGKYNEISMNNSKRFYYSCKRRKR